MAQVWRLAVREAARGGGVGRLWEPFPVRVHLFLFALVVLAVGMLGGAAAGWRAWRLVQERWMGDSLRMAPVAASAVDYFLQPAMTQVVYLAGMAGSLLEEGEGSDGALLRQLEEATRFFGAAALVDVEGRVLASVPAAFASHPVLADRPYFRRVLATGRPALSEPFYAGDGPRGMPMVALAAPVRVRGEMRAVLTALLHLDRFRALARKASGAASDVRLVLISPEGRFVTAPDPVLEGLPLEAYSDLSWDALVQAKEPVPVAWTLEDPRRGVEAAYIGAFALAPWSGWGAMVVRSQALIQREGVAQGLLGFLAVLGVALAVGGPGLLVLWNEARGLSALAKAMEEAEAGREVPRENPIRPSPLGTRELRFLGQRFQEMLDRIHRQHRELQNAYQALRTASFQILLTLVDALDLREASTGYHSRRVGEFARLLARRMGLPEDEVDIIGRGAMLHDLGKIAVPDAILCKPGPLTAEEWEVMRRHPRIGASLLSAHPELSPLAQLVLTHHERWDGKGYPLGLRGAEIPLGSRIFAVADAFDAMISDRPYRKALTMQEAREEIRRCAGTQFDPAVVEAFLSIPDEEWERILARYRPTPPPPPGIGYLWTLR